MIIFSDLHLREDSAKVCFEEVLPGVLNAAIERGDNVIACLGDVFHFRYTVSVKLLNGLRDELRRWHDVFATAQNTPVPKFEVHR